MNSRRSHDDAWRPVTKSEPCRICGKDDWCERNADGTWYHCMRTSNGQPEWDKRQGGWLHRLGPDEPQHVAPARLPAPSSPRPESADLATRHSVYSRLLALCPLTPAHRSYLLGNAWHTKELLAEYGTLPEQQSEIIATLTQEFGPDTLRSIPGIVVREGKLRWIHHGLLIPVRDREGRIQACQVRRDDVPDDQKYRWLSAKDGPSSGAPIHVARPPHIRDERVYIVESPKTANALAGQLQALTLAVAGFGNWRHALPVLDELQEIEEIEVVLIAFDAPDPEAKPETNTRLEEARRALAAHAQAHGYAARIARWDHAEGKGPDDLWRNGHAWAVEIYRSAVGDLLPPDPQVASCNLTLPASPETPDGPTAGELEALPHAALVRRHLTLLKDHRETKRDLADARALIVYIGNLVRMDTTVAEPSTLTADGTSRTRKRQVLTPADRIHGITIGLMGYDSAGRRLPDKPFRAYRTDVANFAHSNPSSVSTSIKTLRTVGALVVTEAPADALKDAESHKPHLYALPAFPTQPTSDQLTAADSPRRAAMRDRQHCPHCDSEDLIERTIAVVYCRGCRRIIKHKEAVERPINPGHVTAVPERQDASTAPSGGQVASCTPIVSTSTGRVLSSKGAAANGHDVGRISPTRPQLIDDLAPLEIAIDTARTIDETGTHAPDVPERLRHRIMEKSASRSRDDFFDMPAGLTETDDANTSVPQPTSSNGHRSKPVPEPSPAPVVPSSVAAAADVVPAEPDADPMTPPALLCRSCGGRSRYLRTRWGPEWVCTTCWPPRTAAPTTSTG